jgi:hypothetical protein
VRAGQLPRRDRCAIKALICEEIAGFPSIRVVAAPALAVPGSTPSDMIVLEPA